MRKPDAPRRHPNRAQKNALKAAEVAEFLRGTGRKAQKGTDPNDRRFDATMTKRTRRMAPELLDRLIRDDDDDAPTD